jgi:hypothetical protein
MRIVLAGLLGGIAMYVWSTIAHVATPLGTFGISTLPDEQVTMNAVAASMGEQQGFYLFPDMRPGHPAAGNPVKEGPFGLLVYRPHASYELNPANLIIEFVTELAETMIAALLLSWVALAGYAARVAFVTLVGVAGAITTNVPYWNWYSFPTNYTLVYSLIEVVGYLAAGLVIAWMLPKPAGSA